jgi:hypothetical protein
VEIHFISSLTEDDEERVALALLGAVEKLLNPFPIAYIVRIETSAGTVLQHNQGAGAALVPASVPGRI